MLKLSGIQKTPLILDKNDVSHREKKIIFIAKILPSGSFQINFFVFCLKRKLFHWNGFDVRKYKECDLISLLGKDAVTEDIYTWIRLSGQQGISFDPTMKSNALFITAVGFFWGFFSTGKYYEVANPSSGLQGWSWRGAGRGNNSALDSSVSQGERKIHEKWMFKNGVVLAISALQWVTSPCIIPGSFPPCPALLGVTEHSQVLGELGFSPCLWALRALCLCCRDHRNCLTFSINPSSPPCCWHNRSIHRGKKENKSYLEL